MSLPDSQLIRDNSDILSEIETQHLSNSLPVISLRFHTRDKTRRHNALYKLETLAALRIDATFVADTKATRGAWMIELLKHFHAELSANRESKLAQWRSEQQDTEEKLARLLELRLDNELSQEEFAEQKRKYNTRLVRTKEQIDAAHRNADE